MSLLVWVEQCSLLKLEELRASTQSKLDMLRTQADGETNGGPSSVTGTIGATGVPMVLQREPHPLAMQILPASFVERSAPGYIAEMWRSSGDTTACFQFYSCKGKVAFRSNHCFQNRFISEGEVGRDALSFLS